MVKQWSPKPSLRVQLLLPLPENLGVEKVSKTVVPLFLWAFALRNMTLKSHFWWFKGLFSCLFRQKQQFRVVIGSYWLLSKPPVWVSFGYEFGYSFWQLFMLLCCFSYFRDLGIKFWQLFMLPCCFFSWYKKRPLIFQRGLSFLFGIVFYCFFHYRVIDFRYWV